MSTPNTTDPAAYMREFRARHGMTQRALADICGVTATTVARWEAGRYQPAAASVLAVQEWERKQMRGKR